MLIFVSWLIMMISGFALGSLMHSWAGFCIPFGIWVLFWGRQALLEWKQSKRGE
jgi:hypothetical protein